MERISCVCITSIATIRIRTPRIGWGCVKVSS